MKSGINKSTDEQELEAIFEDMQTPTEKSPWVGGGGSSMVSHIEHQIIPNMVDQSLIAIGGNQPDTDEDQEDWTTEINFLIDILHSINDARQKAGLNPVDLESIVRDH